MAKKKKPTLNFATDWSYAPAPESTDHVAIENRYDLFIGGKFVPPAQGNYFNTINPATEKRLSSVAEAAKADVNRAVKSARTAYDKYWSKLTATERGKYNLR